MKLMHAIPVWHAATWSHTSQGAATSASARSSGLVTDLLYGRAVANQLDQLV
jgi:hypothetical protein